MSDTGLSMGVAGATAPGGARGSRRPAASIVASLALVVAMPFIIDATEAATARMSMLVCLMLFTPILAIQAHEASHGLDALIGSVGERSPRRTAERRKLHGTAMLLAFAATVQCMAVVVAVRAGWVAAIPRVDGGVWFNVALVGIFAFALVGPFETSKRIVIAACPLLVLVGGHLGAVNAVKVALWEAAMAELTMLVLLRFVADETLATVASLAKDGPRS